MTIWRRFMADTPPLFKKLQLIGIIVAGVCGAVLTFIPPQMLASNIKLYIAIPGAIGTALAAFSGLVVKTLNGLPPDATLQDALNALPGMIQDLIVAKTQIVTTIGDAVNKGQIDKPAADIKVMQQAQDTVDTAIGKVQAVTGMADAFEQAVQDKLSSFSKVAP